MALGGPGRRSYRTLKGGWTPTQPRFVRETAVKKSEMLRIVSGPILVHLPTGFAVFPIVAF